MDEAIHAARFLGRQIAGDIETLHLARDLRAQAGGIEAGNAGDSGLAGNDIGPRLGDADSDWSNDAETGNDYSALFHRASLLCREISASVLIREADHDFSQLLRALQALEARARLRQRVDPVDHGPQGARGEGADRRRVFRRIAARGSQESVLIPEQPPEVGDDAGDSRGAAGEQAADLGQY